MFFHREKDFCFALISWFIQFAILNPLHIFDEIQLDRKNFDQRWCQSQPAACPSCLPCYDSIHSPLLFPECSEQLQVRWGMVFIPQNVVEFVFVARAPGIAVKLWFCFWWGTVTGASTRVAFTALICEHNNANISVGGLFQLSCVMISGIDFDWLFFFFFLTLLYQDLVSCWWFILFAFMYFYLQPRPVRCLFQQKEMSLNKFIHLILIKHSLHNVSKFFVVSRKNDDFFFF